MDGNDRGYDAPQDILEHGSEPGRLAEWSRKRVVRGAATGLLGLGVLGWVVAGSGLDGSSGPDGGAGEPVAAAASGVPQPPSAVPQRGARNHGGEGDRECESEAPGPEAATGRPAGLASARSHALVDAVLRFAVGSRQDADVPWAPRVLVVADGPVETNRSMTGAVASRRTTWTDPSDLLARLAAARPDRLRIDDEHHVTCRGTPREQAAGFEGHDWVSVQPRVTANSCRGWWAIDLYLDEQHRVEAVMVRP